MEAKYLYSKIIPNMGGFHQLHIFQRVIFKLYNCLCLQDWFVDSETITARSASQVFERRHYYRSMCLHKEGLDNLVQRRVKDITNKFELIHPDLLSNLSELRQKSFGTSHKYQKIQRASNCSVKLQLELETLLNFFKMKDKY